MQKGVDVSQYLKDQKNAQTLKLKEAKAAELRGTFEQLLDSYLDKLEGTASHSRVKQSFNRYVRRSHPELLKRYANEISRDNIKDILRKMIQAGITTQVNRVRSQLHAAFNHGIKHDDNLDSNDSKKVLFNLLLNPVTNIEKKAKYETVGDHVIADDDIRRIWNEITEEYFISGHVVKLALATGQRAGELIRLKIENINIEEGYLAIPDTVSKNRTNHVVPLNDLALEVSKSILDEIEDSSIYIFPGIKDGYYCEDTPLNPSTLTQHVREFCNDYEGEKFVPRDIRRTWKTLTGKAGISKDLRDRIQNHAIQDVSTKHYDRYDYYTEKQNGLKVWNDYLDLIVHPRKNVTQLKRA
jgi:integrase